MAKRQAYRKHHFEIVPARDIDLDGRVWCYEPGETPVKPKTVHIRAIAACGERPEPGWISTDPRRTTCPACRDSDSYQPHSPQGDFFS